MSSVEFNGQPTVILKLVYAANHLDNRQIYVVHKHT